MASDVIHIDGGVLEGVCVCVHFCRLTLGLCKPESVERWNLVHWLIDWLHDGSTNLVCLLAAQLKRKYSWKFQLDSSGRESRPT